MNKIVLGVLSDYLTSNLLPLQAIPPKGVQGDDPMGELTMKFHHRPGSCDEKLRCVLVTHQGGSTICTNRQMYVTNRSNYNLIMNLQQYHRSMLPIWQ